VCAPCAQFLNQEVPGDESIHSFVKGKLASSEGNFLIIEKVNVNGSSTHPLYHFLKRHSCLYRQKSGKAMPIPWNYGKFLIDKVGRVVDFQGPTISPLMMEPQIRGILSAPSLL